MARPMKLLALVSGAAITALSTNNNSYACDAASSTATATATSSASHDATSSSTSHAHHDHPSRTTATATAATTHDNDAKLIVSFEEICFFRPKSCTTSSFSFVETPTTKKDEESYKCSLETLNGLSSTRETMQTNIQLLSPSSSSYENSNNNNNISEEEELLGRQLELAHVRLEEAAVGCTLLYYHYYNSATENNNEHDVASEDADASEALLVHSSACPTPKTCNYESNSCTLSALHQLHQSREIMEQAFQKLAYSLDDDGNSSSSGSSSSHNNNHKPMMSNNQEQWMRRRLEIAELSVEEAAIGCTLLLQQIKNNANNKPVGEEQPQATKETTKLLSRIKNDGSTTIKPPPTMVVPFPSNDILQDEDKLDFYLGEHFPDEMYKLSKLKVRRVNMQDILRGVGEMPDVQGKDRMRRDGIIRELKLEEARIRKRLLMQLHELNLRQKNKREVEKEDEDEDEYGQNNIVNREERRIEANKESPPECDNSNSSENDQTTTAFTRDDDDYPSTKDGAISKLKKDIDFLKNKAHEASTEGERDARWQMVRSLEEKLEQMTIRL